MENLANFNELLKSPTPAPPAIHSKTLQKSRLIPALGFHKIENEFSIRGQNEKRNSSVAPTNQRPRVSRLGYWQRLPPRGEGSRAKGLVITECVYAPLRRPPECENTKTGAEPARHDDKTRLVGKHDDELVTQLGPPAIR